MTDTAADYARLIDAGRSAFLPIMQDATDAGAIGAVIILDDDGAPDPCHYVWRLAFCEYADALAGRAAND